MISGIAEAMFITYPLANRCHLWQNFFKSVTILILHQANSITPSQFFDESEENPALLQTAIEELRKLNDDDLMLIIGNIRRLTRE